jgi:hypothetical protein
MPVGLEAKSVSLASWPQAPRSLERLHSACGWSDAQRVPIFSAKLRPNNSFKPKLLRSGNNMAGKACHVVASTTHFGLTQALGGTNRENKEGFLSQGRGRPIALASASGPDLRTGIPSDTRGASSSRRAL